MVLIWRGEIIPVIIIEERPLRNRNRGWKVMRRRPANQQGMSVLKGIQQPVVLILKNENGQAWKVRSQILVVVLMAKKIGLEMLESMRKITVGQSILPQIHLNSEQEIVIH